MSVQPRVGVSVRGSLPAWDICRGGSSGPFLSARIAYLQERSWKVGYSSAAVTDMFRTMATLGVIERPLRL